MTWKTLYLYKKGWRLLYIKKGNLFTRKQQNRCETGGNGGPEIGSGSKSKIQYHILEARASK